VTIWQTFRDAYSKSVIFGKEQPKDALNTAAGKVQGLAKDGS
jgi:multiple sugar transport system substrate-binding protein